MPLKLTCYIVFLSSVPDIDCRRSLRLYVAESGAALKKIKPDPECQSDNTYVHCWALETNSLDLPTIIVFLPRLLDANPINRVKARLAGPPVNTSIMGHPEHGKTNLCMLPKKWLHHKRVLLERIKSLSNINDEFCFDIDDLPTHALHKEVEHLAEELPLEHFAGPRLRNDQTDDSDHTGFTEQHSIRLMQMKVKILENLTSARRLRQSVTRLLWGDTNSQPSCNDYWSIDEKIRSSRYIVLTIGSSIEKLVLGLRDHSGPRHVAGLNNKDILRDPEQYLIEMPIYENTDRYGEQPTIDCNKADGLVLSDVNRLIASECAVKQPTHTTIGKQLSVEENEHLNSSWMDHLNELDYLNEGKPIAKERGLSVLLDEMLTCLKTHLTLTDQLSENITPRLLKSLLLPSSKCKWSWFSRYLLYHEHTPISSGYLRKISEECALQIGVEVEYRDCPELPGFAFRLDQNRFIFCHENMSEIRQAWTIMHELGHFLLKHRSAGASLLDLATLPSDERSILVRQEREANFLADIWLAFFGIYPVIKERLTWNSSVKKSRKRLSRQPIPSIEIGQSHALYADLSVKRGADAPLPVPRVVSLIAPPLAVGDAHDR
jgi:hypothetical protein